jgi:hypothetical protein
MMRRSIRNCAAWALAGLVPAMQGCYEYVPLAATTPPVGELIDFQISDPGRVALNDRFGQGVTDIVGRIVSQQGNELTVNVYRVTQLTGENVQWNGETVHLDRGYVSMIKGRQLSTSRTVLVAAAGVVVAVLLLSSRNLIGSFSGPTSDPPSDGPTPAKVLIPVRP